MGLPLDQAVTGIVVGNDQMALGLVKALRGRGVDVPGDVSVVSFDDIAEAAYFEPALTTISNDFEGRGRLAMDALLSQISPDRPRRVLSQRDPVLVIRDSAAPPR